MIDTVFISDLHLHPEDTAIQARFEAFIAWAKISVKQVYILGDFFHVWVGDDSLNEWSLNIAQQLRSLLTTGISLFYMHGNRDFLLGSTFAAQAGWQVLSEPTVIQLGNEKVLLAHGDRYCTDDKAHQRFRYVTRNRLFKRLFLSLPLTYRQRLANKVRALSQGNRSKSTKDMDVVSETVIKHMNQYQISTLIHGHTHQPGLTRYNYNTLELKRYVLSDWDDNPRLLCYDNTMGIYFKQL